MELNFLIITLISLSSTFHLPSAAVKPPSGDMNWWCNQTPYPEPCKHFMSQNNNNPRKYFSPQKKSDFRKMAIQLALERATCAVGNTKALGAKCRNERERAAWSDCVKLYESTIEQLNKTVDPTINCTDFDSQTWLSTALTNIETCRTGFLELNVTDFVFPLISNNNVSKLICNTLALGDSGNETNHETKGYYNKAGFPTWFSKGNRRLLQTTVSADVVVAQDGSGDNRTIKAALDVAARRSSTAGRFVILVKRGVYSENIEIAGSKMKNIMIVGDGIDNTIITGNRSVGGGSTTFESATVIVTAEGFIARGITIRNTAGPENHQAVALRSGADLSVFYRCSFEAYQDTLYVHSQRQFYKECDIYGTIDFIFGNAAAVLQDCKIYARRPMVKQKNVVTAQGRTDPNQNTGISIHNSRVMASPDLVPVLGSFRSFLGRPWKLYSRTVYMQTYIDSLIDPVGWLEWDGSFALDTLYYGEYRNSGPGSNTTRRVNWSGYRVITNASEASTFTVANFIAGQSWLPATGVPFTAGL
ncbi:hypothetical protein ABFS82_06G045600 [Erythranthe guttata]|uniref:Pectinesterase n=1 Tax=Erythranthe guttata TaxID=4155 RepID=A0A022QEQ4_ERYGU|nr:PREDICTED: pectinesterase 2-like [Erythranthe guttata]EYU24970.1 hypothetical protein MIMGU_mgv1a022192mg [Erythranthe guttata]|eukprot:XP_012852027.1 PREDICTED: pectinesterase 2-like [Erythranthe guttata]